MYKLDSLNGLIVLGFGGHARSIADVALSAGFTKLLFVDENARPGEKLGEHPVVKDMPNCIPGWRVLPASGDNERRQQQLLWATERGWQAATLVAPSATIGYAARLGKGVFIAHHVHIGPFAEIGDGCIINTAAVVEHETKIGCYSHVSVNSTIAGRSVVGERCFIGAGATVIDSLQLCDQVTLGAGACAVKNLDKPGTYIGVPARPCSGNQAQ